MSPEERRAYFHSSDEPVALPLAHLTANTYGALSKIAVERPITLLMTTLIFVGLIYGLQNLP